MIKACETCSKDELLKKIVRGVSEVSEVFLISDQNLKKNMYIPVFFGGDIQVLGKNQAIFSYIVLV